tara:strand:+ start:969 stop:1808 length:840 start_codon:yes stop_codon:yes gene_type:complete
MPTLAPKLPYTHPFAGGYPYRGSQRLPSDPDALTYLAAVAAADGAPVEVGVAMAVDDFFRGVKADNTFSAIKAACLLCGARTLAGALVPLVGTAPTNVADGFVAGDYTRGGATPGLKGDGTSYLDSGRADNADPQDDNHLSVFVTVTPTGATQDFAGTASASAERVLRQNADTDIAQFLNNDTNTGGTSGVPTAGTLFATSRSSSSAYTVRLNGVNITRTSASTGVNALSAFIFCRNLNGSPFTFSQGTLAFYSIGEALDLEALENRVSALVTAIGAAV